MGKEFMGTGKGRELNIPIAEMDKKPDKKKKEKRENRGLPVIYEPVVVQVKKKKTKTGKEQNITQRTGTFKNLENEDVLSLIYYARISPNSNFEKNIIIQLLAQTMDFGIFATNTQVDLVKDPKSLTYRKNLKEEIQKIIDRVKKWEGNPTGIKKEIIADMVKESSVKSIDVKGYAFDPKYFHYLTDFLQPIDKSLQLGIINLELDINTTHANVDLTSAEQIARKLETGSGKAKVSGKRQSESAEVEELHTSEDKYWKEQDKKSSQYTKEDLYADLKKNPISGASQLIGQVTRTETIQWPELFFEYLLDNKKEYEFDDSVFDASFADFNDIQDLTNELIEERDAIQGVEAEEEAEEMDDFMDESNLESGDTGEESTEERGEKREENRVTLQTEDKNISVEDALEAGKDIKEKKTFYESTKYTKLVKKAEERFKLNHPSDSTKGRHQSMDIRRKLTFVQTGDAYYQQLASVELAPKKKKRLQRKKYNPVGQHRIGKDKKIPSGSKKNIQSTLKMIKRTFLTMKQLIKSIG